MPTWRSLAAVAGFVSIVGAPHTGWAQQLIPFTPVPSVCPSCTTGPQYDRVVLVGGSELRARVVAENDRFYVLERFGELRAAGRDQVQTIERNPNAEHPATYADQILFRDGIVLGGALRSAKDDADPFEITVPPANSIHVAAQATILAVYRAGKHVFPAAK